jgi:hypothetical protein
VEKPEPLSYATVPPPDRAQLARYDDGFVLTIPPLSVWRVAVSASLLAGVGIILVVLPYLPVPGRGYGMLILAEIAGLCLLFSAASLFGSQREPAVLTVRNVVLTVTTARLFGRTDRSYTLSEYKEATTNSHESRGDLVLIGLSGNEEILLLRQIFSLVDLNIAAREIRTEINRLDPEYVRQELELDVRLKELRDGLPDAPPSGFIEQG